MSNERRPGSRLPEDPAYWDDLAARSVEAAFSGSTHATPSASAHAPLSVAARGAARDPWWRGVSDAAFVLAASAVLALLGGILLLEERSPHAVRDSRALAGAIAPDDPLLASLLTASAEAPPASVLFKLMALREEAR